MDHNKLEDDLKQIDEFVSDKPRPQSSMDSEKEQLEQTREYLAIILRELDELKAGQSVQNTKNKTGKKKTKAVWKWIALTETVLLLSGGIIYGVYQHNLDSVKQTQAVQSTADGTIHSETGLTVRETVKNNSELKSLTAQLSGKEINGFTVSVEELFGYEYLMFSDGMLKVYYRNEYPKDENNQRYNIMIDNGTRISEYNWEYDLKSDLLSLCPYYGSYLGTEEKQLVFPVYTKNQINIPKEIRMVQSGSLIEYESIDPAQMMRELFTLSFEEEALEGGQTRNKMKLKISSAQYTYLISQEEYMNAVYYEENPLDFEENFKLEITQDSILMQTVVKEAKDAYLGELSAKVTQKEGTLALGSVKYGAYVLASQEDTAGDQVITPRTSILPEERISLWGKNHETYLIALSDTLERNQLNMDGFRKENGIMTYYENGVKTSIAGIDVSKYQGDVDWDKVKAAGAEYAIVRLGFRGNREGTLELDPYFIQNVEGAAKAGLNVGVYFFSQAVTIKEAQEEAAFVLENIKDYQITYPVIFDTEEMAGKNARANNLGRQLRTDIAKTFCESVKIAGYQPMIYANTKWMIMGLDLEQLTDYDLWFAYYGDNLTFPYAFSMYQYSQEGKIDGINGAVDLNLSFKDYAANADVKAKADEKK